SITETVCPDRSDVRFCFNSCITENGTEYPKTTRRFRLSSPASSLATSAITSSLSSPGSTTYPESPQTLSVYSSSSTPFTSAVKPKPSWTSQVESATCSPGVPFEANLDTKSPANITPSSFGSKD